MFGNRLLTDRKLQVIVVQTNESGRVTLIFRIINNARSFLYWQRFFTENPLTHSVTPCHMNVMKQKMLRWEKKQSQSLFVMRRQLYQCSTF